MLLEVNSDGRACVHTAKRGPPIPTPSKAFPTLEREILGMRGSVGRLKPIDGMKDVVVGVVAELMVVTSVSTLRESDFCLWYSVPEPRT